jgi:hypothetical protein
MGIYIFLIPIPVPGYIFAPLYLLYCWYMARRNMDNIGQTAKFGARIWAEPQFTLNGSYWQSAYYRKSPMHIDIDDFA